MLPALALRLRVRVLLALLAAAAVCLLATPAVRKLPARSARWTCRASPGASTIIRSPARRAGAVLSFLAGVLPFTGIDEPVQGYIARQRHHCRDRRGGRSFGSPPWVKLVLQIAAAVVAIRHGVVIRILTNPGDASAEAIALGALSVPVTLLWIVGMTNALNHRRARRARRGRVRHRCASMLAVSLFLPQATEISVLVAALGGACLGFLPFNINPAKIFMGDSGSLLLGYVLHGVGARPFKMYTLVAFAVPVLTLALPLTDTVFAVVRRVSRGEPVPRRPRPHPPPAARAGTYAEAGGRRALCRQRHSRRGGAARGERRKALLAAARCGGARARHMAVCFAVSFRPTLR